MKTNFNLKKSKSKGKSLILLVIRWDKRKIAYSTKEFINPKYWETDKEKRNFQRAKETREFPEYPEFNARLKSIESSAENAFRKFQNDNNREPSVEELKQLLDIVLRNAQTKQKMDLFSFIKQYILEAESRFNLETGKALAKGTIGIYKNTLLTLKEYSNKKQKRIDFDTIDLNFYNEYMEYLAKEKNLANNTIGRHIKTIKSFLNDAAEREIHKNLSFKSKKFKVLTEKIDSTYLNTNELDELHKLDLSNRPNLEHVRDLFLVGCWTGLRFSDFSQIEPEHIQGDRIVITTKKTDERVVIPILPPVKSIMEKYKNKFPNSLPPSISNAKTNKHLKEIGSMLECLNIVVTTKITKGGQVLISNLKKYELLVTHTARRSFATNMYKSGLSSITIMKTTGHRTERAFLTYIKVTPDENATLLEQHWLKMENTEKQIKELV